MRQANELPFGFHLDDAPQGELAETAGWFDLSAVFIPRETGRLDLSRSFLVSRTPFFGPQRTGQTLLRGE